MPTFRFRVGRSRSVFGKGGKRQTFIATDNAAIDEIKDALTDGLTAQILSVAAEMTEDAILKAQSAINKDLEADLNKYVRDALAFFFRQTSTPDQPLVISLASISNPLRSVGFTTAVPLGKSEDYQIVWAPLADATIMKKHNSVYFIHTFQLKNDLEAFLPGFFQDILSPGLKVTFTYDGKKRAGKVPVANLEAVLATGNFKGNSFTNMAFQRGQIFSADPMNTGLLRAYISSQLNDASGVLADRFIIDKLANKAHPDKERPFWDAAMSYWALMRYPVVFENSVRKNLKIKRTSI